MYRNKILQGDCYTAMTSFPDSIIDLTVTSPPYDNLREYEGQIKWNEKVWKCIVQELFRVTKDGGVVVWVVGDAVVNGSETGTSFKQALFFKEVGFNIHDTMIYQKNNFANPSRNRYHQIFEYMFVFSKGKPKTFNPIKDRENKYSQCWGKKTIRQKDGEMKEAEKGKSQKFGSRYNIWKMNTAGQENPCKKNLHPAQFPLKLAEDQIKSWSNKGDLVFDPFAGAGTTGVAAKNLKRDYLLVELVSDYVKIIKDRIN